MREIGSRPRSPAGATSAGERPRSPTSEDNSRLEPVRDRVADMAPALANLPQRPQRNPQPLSTADLELAAYFLARDVTREPVAPEAQDLLRRVNESKKEVLTAMPYGRSNVAADLAATDNTGLYRLRAQRQVVGNRSSLNEPEAVRQFQQAAVTASVGSGNCSEHARLAAHVHAGRLLPGEQVQVVSAPQRDHAWAEVHGARTDGQTPTAAVLDVWGEGPVIEPRDAYFRQASVGPLEIDHTLEGQEAVNAHQGYVGARDGGSTAQKRRLDTLVAAETRKAAPHTGHVYTEPVPIVVTSLAHEAHRAIQAHSPRGLQEKAQAAVLASRNEVSPEQALAAAPRVVDMASDLLAPRERPLAPPDAHAPQAAEDPGSDSDSLGVDSDAEEPPAKRQRTLERP